MNKYLVFSDLDGTFLNHDDYSFSDALPAVARLTQLDIPIIFSSSKTLSEITSISNRAGINCPLIYETGCGIAWPDQYFPHLDGTQHRFCREYSAVTEFLDAVRLQYEFDFKGFHDLGVDVIAEITGLSIEQAEDAASRRYGEPLLWQGSESSFELFEEIVDRAGFCLIQGGRFIHIMSPVDKSRAVRWLLNSYQQNDPGASWLCAGLGDSPNDQQLLETVDFPFLVRNLHLQSEQQELMKIQDIRQTTQCGAAGWNEAINSFLDKIL